MFISERIVDYFIEYLYNWKGMNIVVHPYNKMEWRKSYYAEQKKSNMKGGKYSDLFVGNYKTGKIPSMVVEVNI